ncbi:MAG: tetratricopeptide repeat protein, partial [Pseudomonadota bacterium]|nr:tetratricopeptide repeat protein [Pseudomonadota bacterium]
MPVKKFTRIGSLLAILAATTSAALWWILRPLPELPQPDLSALEPGIKRQIQEALDAAQARPRDVDTVAMLGKTLLAYDRPEDAARCFARASALQADDFRWTYLQAQAQRRSGNSDRATTLLRETITQEPTFLPARLALGEALLDAGEIDAAAPLFEQLAGEYPESPHALFGLGRVRAERGQSAEAVTLLRRALVAADRRWGAAHYALALALRDSGERDLAQRQLRLYEAHKEIAPRSQDPLLNEVAQSRRGAEHYLNL